MKLNLACGGSRWDGFDNSDIEGGDRYVDLDKPLPYPDNSAELVLLSHALFMGTPDGKALHQDMAAIMREICRVLERGGWLRIDDNPSRCYWDANPVSQAEANEEAYRGYPDDLRITREHLIATLRAAGFSQAWNVPQDATLIEADEATTRAILGNRMGHVSFTVEALK